MRRADTVRETSRAGSPEETHTLEEASLDVYREPIRRAAEPYPVNRVVIVSGKHRTER